MTFLKIHQLIVRIAAAAMLHLLYSALHILLSRGMIPSTQRIRSRIYGDIMYKYGLYDNASLMSPLNKAQTER